MLLDPTKKLFRWGPISACPLFMYYTIKPSFGLMKKVFDHCYSPSIIIFKDNKVAWLLDLKQFKEYGERFSRANIENSQRYKEYLKYWDKVTNNLENQFKRLYQTDFKNFGDDELTKLFRDFCKIYFDWWTCTMSVELVTITLEPKLGELLETYYQNKDVREYNKSFAILSSPDGLTFYREEQRDLVKILKLPRESQVDALQRHRDKYHWIYNSYLEAKDLKISYFQKELDKLSQEKENSLKLLEEIEKYPDQIKQEKQQIFTQINADTKLIKLTGFVSKFSILQDERKALNFKADHFLELFVNEFSLRTKKSIQDIKNLLPDELTKPLAEIDFEKSKKRQIASVFNCTEDNIDEVTGENALQVHKAFKKVKKTKESMIHGRLASTGDEHYFRGVAKIIMSIDQIDEVEEGDVLITTMTSPDFVIGMKKAGAIITDEGGLLCHAAIVSRELKKPCIVGAKIATKVIKNGDVVELHCGRGAIKIIKKS